MFDPDRRKSYGVTSAILAWLVFFSYVASFVASAAFSRLSSGPTSVDYNPSVHMTLGLVAFFFVVLRLLWWLKNDRPKAPKTMSDKAYALSRVTLLLMYLNVLQLSVSGFMKGWSLGTASSIFAWVPLPALEEDMAVITSSVHNTGLLINSVILMVYIVVNAYLGFRYKVGYRRMLPGVHV